MSTAAPVCYHGGVPEPIPAIEVVNLSKRFRPRISWRHREIVALDRVSLRVQPGEAVGLLGPNGSGKSTLLRILSTVFVPSSGHAWVGGVSIEQVHRVKPMIGVVPPDARGFHGRLSGRHNLAFFAALQQVPPQTTAHRVAVLLRLVGLAELDGQPFWTYSTGQRQRLNLARALLHDPPILLLDEPTKGLDPWGARRLCRWLRDELIQRQGKTLLVASHQVDDLRVLTDRVIVLRHGRLAWQGPWPEATRPLAALEAAMAQERW